MIKLGAKLTEAIEFKIYIETKGLNPIHINRKNYINSKILSLIYRFNLIFNELRIRNI